MNFTSVFSFLLKIQGIRGIEQTAIEYMGKIYTYDDADDEGYVTVYGTSHGHIDYLDELAVKNGLR